MSKTNVRVVNPPEYIVIKEKGVIVCKMTVEIGNYPALEYSAYRRLSDKFDGWDYQKTFTAVTKHRKSDVWNEILGKRIAESKCKRKIYKYYSRIMLAISNEFLKFTSDLNNYAANLTYACKRENKHLKDLMG